MSCYPKIRVSLYNCTEGWVLLYVQRWLTAPLQQEDGSLTPRDKGTPQGEVVSPVLANLFMHYAFDAWVGKELPGVEICRYADDGLLHCTSQKQAEYVMRRISERFRECGLEIHPDKSHIVYCKDATHTKEYPRVSFDFLGFTFRPRRCVNKRGQIYPNFLPAVSKAALKEMNRCIRSWKIQLKSWASLEDIAKLFNPILRGWYNYYGRFYPSALHRLWKNFHEYLARWVQRKYQRFSGRRRKARAYVNALARANKHLFFYWKLGMFATGLSDGSRMK